MPGKTKTILTPAMQAQVDEIRRAYAAYEAAKDSHRPDVWAWVKQELDRRAAEPKSKLEAALRAGLEMGIPKRVIQTPEVLGSTSQKKIDALLGTAPKRARSAAVPLFSWLDDTTARIVIPKFDTLSAASDYPDQLAGVVRRDPSMPGGWAALTDESDEGNLPGHLRWELDQEASPRHLGLLLDGLAAKAKR